MKKAILLLAVLFSFSIAVVSCDDNDDTQKSYPFSVRLTDAPGPYDEVNINIQGVEINGNNGGNVMISTETGFYDLLELSSGVETTISNDILYSSKVNQIRLIL